VQEEKLGVREEKPHTNSENVLHFVLQFYTSGYCFLHPTTTNCNLTKKRLRQPRPLHYITNVNIIVVVAFIILVVKKESHRGIRIEKIPKINSFQKSLNIFLFLNF